ncbi:MAG: malto-oligosyltrehalose synthase [Acidimicrobiales bacterium]
MPTPSPTSSSSTTPTATYRLQLRAGVTLDTVRQEWLEPLAELGISHLYLSPVFEATDGSTHGYDVVDPTAVDRSLGGDEAFDALADAAHELGLGIVVDLVPNHVATDHDRNAAWWDLLRNGPASPSAELFDLDWNPPERRLRGRLLLPVLPDHYGRELEAGAFRLEVVRDEPQLTHPSVRCPLELSSLAGVLRRAADRSGDSDLGLLADSVDALPPWELPFADGVLDRRQAQESAARGELGRLLRHDEVRTAVQTELDATTADVEALDDLIGAQPYRLARWQTASEDLGYRRFFDINTLVGVRVDRRPVFDRMHRLVERWVATGKVDGLRVDHVDGLRWPTTYLEWLRELAPDAWIVVEKILEGDENLPPWPIDGTTGYEVADLVDRLDLDDSGRPALERTARWVGGSTDVSGTIYDAKVAALDDLLAADLNRLTELLIAVCEQRRRFRDVTRRELHRALRAVLAHFEVYRTYLRPGAGGDAPGAGSVVASAIGAAAAELDDVDAEIFELLALLLDGNGSPSFDDRTDLEWDFIARFQQLCSPTMAKGAEDTAWFRLPALLSRCEVGASPDDWGVGLEEFHRAMERRQREWPRAMTTTSTHDTKRSEDVRARLAILSQDGESWEQFARDWMRTAGADSPDRTITYQLLQTMVAAWPLDEDRLATQATKLAREAKQRTSWLRPDEAFEDELLAHVHRLVTTDEATGAIESWVERTRPAADATALTHKALALMLPGVPDLYQGSEHWFRRLTDPDNREPADPTLLRARLQELRTGPPVGPSDPLAKLALIRSCLAVRTRHPRSFDERGTYRPLWAAGPRSDHAVAFVRGDDVVVVATRNATAVADGWNGTTIDLPEGRTWRASLGDAAHKGRCDLDDLLAEWPVVVLEADD